MTEKVLARLSDDQNSNSNKIERAIATLDNSTADAVGLPAMAYTSEDFLDRERRTVFTNHWVCVGIGSDLPNFGDLVPVEVAGMPIMLVRDRSSKIRAFHNICSHRGLQLVTQPCQQQKLIRCPYHSWSYALDGELKSTPHFGGYWQDTYEGFDRASKNLQSIKCEQWLDLIFINLVGNAPPLEDYLQPVIERWSDYDLSLLSHGRDLSFEFDANWKLAVENFSESYHLPWVHPQLNNCSRMEDHFGFEVGENHVGQGSKLYRIGAMGDLTLPVFPNLPESRETVAEYISVFPNLMLGIHPDYFLALTVNPLSPTRSVERMSFYFIGDGATSIEYEALRQIPIDLWKITNEEDLETIERLQKGRKSPAFDGGCFSPALETTVHQFQRLVAKAIANK
ncbi:aromatic ring-hydroxylating oxygenase subunit alpha [Pleurocapsa sp. FMAR1]|uniref:aromatic ring-hydroxylating oxygenase subunit alpha n=1 Tax=Pleurocapsa sp. FMAR1 TaxID=3040204 RepID=UPI0029C7C9FF|nr:aromatic ring-hydroxylating dioxygenase subunit alpha [Pleurocapsa sp. FMAR1]